MPYYAQNYASIIYRGQTLVLENAEHGCPGTTGSLAGNFCGVKNSLNLEQW